MKIYQILSIHHIQDLISLSPIMNPMKTLFYYHTTMATDLKTQSLRSHRTTQLLRSIDLLQVHTYSYNEPTTANEHHKNLNG